MFYSKLLLLNVAFCSVTVSSFQSFTPTMTSSHCPFGTTIGTTICDQAKETQRHYAATFEANAFFFNCNKMGFKFQYTNAEKYLFCIQKCSKCTQDTCKQQNLLKANSRVDLSTALTCVAMTSYHHLNDSSRPRSYYQ